MAKPKNVPQFVPPAPAGLGPVMPGQSLGPATPLPATSVKANQQLVPPPPAQTPQIAQAPAGLFDEFLPQSQPMAQNPQPQTQGLFDEFLPQPAANAPVQTDDQMLGDIYNQYPALGKSYKGKLSLHDATPERKAMLQQNNWGDRQSEWYGPGPAGKGQLTHPNVGKYAVEFFDPKYATDRGARRNLVLGEMLHGLSDTDPQYEKLRQQVFSNFSPDEMKVIQEQLYPRDKDGNETLQQTLNRTTGDAYIRAYFMPEDPQSAEWTKNLTPKQVSTLEMMKRHLQGNDPAPPPKASAVKKPLHGDQTAGKVLPPPPPTEQQLNQLQFQKGLAQGKAQGAAAGRQLLNSLEGVPFVGPIVKGAEGTVQQIADTGNAIQTKGFPMVMGAATAGLLPGALDLPQGIANLSNQLTRQAHKANFPPVSGLSAAMDVLDAATKGANKLMGRGETKPIRVKEEARKIPEAAATLAETMGASDVPGLKDVVAATKQFYKDPALAPATGLGETAGGIASSMLMPWAVPVKAAGVLSNPLLHGMVSGAVNAPGYGALSNLGQQAQAQQQAGEIKPLDLGQAANAGLETIPAGALLGGVGGAAAGTKKVLTNLRKGESGAQNVQAGPQTIDVQGTALTLPDALKALDNPQVPTEYKQHILAALDAADNALISGQQAATQTIPAKPVERGPAPASKQPKPEQPGWRMGQPKVTPEQAAFEAGKGTMAPAQQVPMPIGEGLGFDHIKDYNQGEWVGPQQVSTAGPKDPNAVNQGMWTGSQPEGAPAPVSDVAIEPNAAKATGYANPFTDSTGKTAQMPLAQFKAAAEEVIQRAPDAATVDQAYNDAEAWASKNVKGALKKPYQQELVRLREERLAELAPAQPGLFDEFLPQETASVTAPSESTPPPVAAESFAPPPAEAATTPRYLVEKHPDKKGYWNLLDTATGAVLRSNKDAKQLSTTAEKWNVDGQTDQGKAQIPLSEGVIKEGKPLPADAPQAVRESFEEIGYLKNEYDKIRAQMEGVAQAIGSISGGKVPTRLARLHSPAAEAKRRQLLTENPADFGLEVNSEGRLPPDMSFLEGQTKQQLYEHYQTLADRLSQTEDEMRAAKQKLHMPHDSVTFDFDGRKFNIRQVPQRGESVKAFGSEQKWGGKQIADTKAFVKKAIRTSSPAELEQVYSSAANSTTADAPPVAEPSGKNLLQFKAAADKVSNIIADAVSDFVHGEEGSGEVGYGVDLATLGTGRAIASSLAKGAQHGEVRHLIENGRELVDNVLKLRRTLDFVHDYDAALHNAIWRNIAMETIQGRGIKFDESHQPLLEQSMRMEANAIRMGEEGLDQLTAEQRHYLATRRKVRMESARLLSAEMESLEKQFGNPKNMPAATRSQYEAMDDLVDGLTGNRKSSGGLVRWANAAMYEYLFKWNPAYHALNLTDPLVAGSSRVALHKLDFLGGFQRVAAAKAAVNPILGDPKVREYISQIADVMEDPTRTDKGGNGLLQYVPGLNKLPALPDPPSVQWNNRDVVAAGFLLHADRIKYPGGGFKFLRDLAGGKLSEQQQVEAMIEALQVNNDVNGAGTHGLDRDFIQRSELRLLLQFTSQPMRQTRLFSKYLREGRLAALGTAFAAQLVLTGSGVVPREVEVAWQAADPDGYDNLQKALNQCNLIENLAGRSVTDKLRWSIIPFLSGSTSNVALEKLMDVAKAVWKLSAEHGVTNVPGDLADATARGLSGQQTSNEEKTLLTLLASVGAGGGGGTASRLWKEIEAGVAGVKEERAHMDPYLDLFQPYAIAKRKIQQYELPQAVGNALLPGKPAETAQWERDERTKKAKKNLLKLKKND